MLKSQLLRRSNILALYMTTFTSIPYLQTRPLVHVQYDQTSLAPNRVNMRYCGYCDISNVGIYFLNISMVGIVSISGLHSVINVSFSRCFHNATNTLVTTYWEYSHTQLTIFTFNMYLTFDYQFAIPLAHTLYTIPYYKQLKARFGSFLTCIILPWCSVASKPRNCGFESHRKLHSSFLFLKIKWIVFWPLFVKQ